MSDTTRINIQIPSELHKELKVLAANQSQTLAAVVTNAVKNLVKDSSK